MKRSPLFVLVLAAGVALADDAPKAKVAAPATEAQEKTKEDVSVKTKDDSNLGMSILGNQEAPKALVIVPWKRSEIGTALGISTMLDDSRMPVDKEVFMRMLSYYEIRSETARQGGAPVAGRDTAVAEKSDAAPAAAAQRRKK